MTTAPSMLAPPIGRPRKLTDIKDFQAEIDAYFAGRDVACKPYTMHGLARHLDCSRNTLLRYEEYDDAEPFCRAIQRARERIAEWVEDRLYSRDSNVAGPIFSLKNNCGWKDEQSVAVNVAVAVGIQADDAVRRGLVPQLVLDQVSVQTLSPAPELLTALSPAPKIAVSDDQHEAKATPIMGVSPPNVA